MPFRIKKATSIVVATGSAFPHGGPDSVLVDAGAYLISDDNGDGMNLSDEWTITVNGIVAAFGPSGGPGIHLTSTTPACCRTSPSGPKAPFMGLAAPSSLAMPST